MTQEAIQNFITETFSKPHKISYLTNLKGYEPENIRGYRHISVIIDNFLKFGFTIPLKIKTAQKKDSFENILITSKKKIKIKRK